MRYFGWGTSFIFVRILTVQTDELGAFRYLEFFKCKLINIQSSIDEIDLF